MASTGGTGSKSRTARGRSEGSRSGASDDFGDDPLDSMLEVKKSARRRLIGSVALVVTAIVFVPMLFESGQKPAAEDVAIQIPDKNSPFEAAPAPPAAGAGTNPQPEAAPAASGVVQREALPPAPAPVAAEPQPPASVSSTAAAAAGEAARAGETAPQPPPAEKPEVATEASTESFAVQIGAFSDSAKAESLKSKLAKGGLKPYTEVVATTEGDRTRLRIGPYPTRDAAEKAQARVKKLFALDSKIVPI